MHPQRVPALLVNCTGGAAVLASYAVGIARHADAGAALWGGVPEWLRPIYTLSMLLAAIGYFQFGPYIVFRLHPEGTRIGSRFGYGLFTLLFAVVLIPSAVWMPLTFAWRAEPSDLLWLCDRLVLLTVGAGAVGILLAVIVARPVPSRAARTRAIVGAAFFVFQTAVLDALVWPAFYRN